MMKWLLLAFLVALPAAAQEEPTNKEEQVVLMIIRPAKTAFKILEEARRRNPELERDGPRFTEKEAYLHVNEFLRYVYGLGDEIFPIVEEMLKKRKIQKDRDAYQFQDACAILVGLEVVPVDRRLRVPRRLLRKRHLKDNIYFDVLTYSIGVLGAIGSDEDVDLILPHVAHTEQNVRCWAIRAIGRIGRLSDIERLKAAVAAAPPLVMAPRYYDTAPYKDDFPEGLTAANAPDEDSRELVEGWAELVQEELQKAIAGIRERAAAEAPLSSPKEKPSEPASRETHESDNQSP